MSNADTRAVLGQRITERLLGRVRGQRRIGVSSRFFEALGVEDPWAHPAAQAWDDLMVYLVRVPAEVDGEEAAAAPSRRAPARRHRRARSAILSRAQRASEGRWVPGARFRARSGGAGRGMAIARSSFAPHFVLPHWARSGDEAEELEVEANTLRPMTRSQLRRRRSRRLEAAVRPSGRATPESVWDDEPVATPLGRLVEQVPSSPEEPVARALEDMIAATRGRQRAQVREALRSVKGVPPAQRRAVARRSLRAMSSPMASATRGTLDRLEDAGESPVSVAIARSRGPASSTRGLRPILRTSPAFVALQADRRPTIAPAADEDAPRPQRRQLSAPAAHAASAHREVPATAAAREARQQRTPARGAPPVEASPASFGRPTAAPSVVEPTAPGAGAPTATATVPHFRSLRPTEWVTRLSYASAQHEGSYGMEAVNEPGRTGRAFSTRTGWRSAAAVRDADFPQARAERGQAGARPSATQAITARSLGRRGATAPHRAVSTRRALDRMGQTVHQPQRRRQIAAPATTYVTAPPVAPPASSDVASTATERVLARGVASVRVDRGRAPMLSPVAAASVRAPAVRASMASLQIGPAGSATSPAAPRGAARPVSGRAPTVDALRPVGSYRSPRIDRRMPVTTSTLSSGVSARAAAASAAGRQVGVTSAPAWRAARRADAGTAPSMFSRLSVPPMAHITAPASDGFAPVATDSVATPVRSIAGASGRTPAPAATLAPTPATVRASQRGGSLADVAGAPMLVAAPMAHVAARASRAPVGLPGVDGGSAAAPIWSRVTRAEAVGTGRQATHTQAALRAALRGGAAPRRGAGGLMIAPATMAHLTSPASPSRAEVVETAPSRPLPRVVGRSALRASPAHRGAVAALRAPSPGAPRPGRPTAIAAVERAVSRPVREVSSPTWRALSRSRPVAGVDADGRNLLVSRPAAHAVVAERAVARPAVVPSRGGVALARADRAALAASTSTSSSIATSATERLAQRDAPPALGRRRGALAPVPTSYLSAQPASMVVPPATEPSPPTVRAISRTVQAARVDSRGAALLASSPVDHLAVSRRAGHDAITASPVQRTLARASDPVVGARSSTLAGSDRGRAEARDGFGRSRAEVRVSQPGRRADSRHPERGRAAVSTASVRPMRSTGPAAVVVRGDGRPELGATASGAELAPRTARPAHTRHVAARLPVSAPWQPAASESGFAPARRGQASAPETGRTISVGSRAAVVREQAHRRGAAPADDRSPDRRRGDVETDAIWVRAAGREAVRAHGVRPGSAAYASARLVHVAPMAAEPTSVASVETDAAGRVVSSRSPLRSAPSARDAGIERLVVRLERRDAEPREPSYAALGRRVDGPRTSRRSPVAHTIAGSDLRWLLPPQAPAELPSAAPAPSAPTPRVPPRPGIGRDIGRRARPTASPARRAIQRSEAPAMVGAASKRALARQRASDVGRPGIQRRGDVFGAAAPGAPRPGVSRRGTVAPATTFVVPPSATFAPEVDAAPAATARWATGVAAPRAVTWAEARSAVGPAPTPASAPLARAFAGAPGVQAGPTSRVARRALSGNAAATALRVAGAAPRITLAQAPTLAPAAIAGVGVGPGPAGVPGVSAAVLRAVYRAVGQRGYTPVRGGDAVVRVARRQEPGTTTLRLAVRSEEGRYVSERRAVPPTRASSYGLGRVSLPMVGIEAPPVAVEGGAVPETREGRARRTLTATLGGLAGDSDQADRAATSRRAAAGGRRGLRPSVGTAGRLVEGRYVGRRSAGTRSDDRLATSGVRRSRAVDEGGQLLATPDLDAPTSQQPTTASGPRWASRASGRSPVPQRDARTSRIAGIGGSHLFDSLARAATPDDVVQVLMERRENMRNLAGQLPSPAIRMVERIVRMETTRRAEEQAKVVVRSARKSPGADFLRTIKRSRGPRGGPATTTAGVGESRVTALANKLMKLIHMAEVERRVGDAQDQVRMATESVSSDMGGPSGSSGDQSNVSLKTLQAEVLKAVERELELRDLRASGDMNDGNFWW